MLNHEDIDRRYSLLRPTLDERGRRLFAAAEAAVIGYGGISAMARITGLPRASIARGLAELRAGPGPGGIRRPGGGRKRKSEQNPSLLADLEEMLAPDKREDPQPLLRWTVRSVRQMTAALRERGHDVSRRIVFDLLRAWGYRLQNHKKV
jgi:hypothetical protein